MVDLLGKKEIYIPSISMERGSSALLYASVALFFLIAASIGGLFLLNRSQREAHAVLLEEVTQKEGELKVDLINQIFLLDQRLKNLRTLVAEHVFPTNVIRFMEINTMTTVRFSSFNFDAVSRKLDMTGEAATYASLSRQVNLFESDPNVELVEFGGLSISGNAVGFKVTIIFKKSFLQLKL